MDTISLRLNEDRTPNWLPYTVIGIMMLSFWATAKATESIAYVVPTNINLSSQVVLEEEMQANLEKEFDERIKNKYPNSKIFTLNKGVKRIKVTRYFNSRPVRLNIIETDFKVNPNLSLKPAIAGNTLNKKAKLQYFNEKQNAIVSVNGGYFKPETGVPLGLLMIDGRIYTGHIYDRVAMGVFENGFKMERAKVNITLKNKRQTLTIDNINQPRMLSTHTLIYDNLWGIKSPPAPKHGVVFSVSSKGKILEVSTGSITIPDGGFVVSAPKSKVVDILKSKKLSLTINTTPNWQGVKHIISGGPYLIKDGEVYIDVTAQKLNAITGKNPRTAIGYTKDGNIIIVTADGREKSSVGLTLGELARYMKQLGCVNAMNLDGGSSTTMYGAGQVLNNPATSGGIAVSNVISIIDENYLK